MKLRTKGKAMRKRIGAVAAKVRSRAQSQSDRGEIPVFRWPSRASAAQMEALAKAFAGRSEGAID